MNREGQIRIIGIRRCEECPHHCVLKDQGGSDVHTCGREMRILTFSDKDTRFPKWCRLPISSCNDFSCNKSDCEKYGVKCTDSDYDQCASCDICKLLSLCELKVNEVS